MIVNKDTDEGQRCWKWLSQHYGIEESEILGYNDGICYATIWVQTQEAAEKVAAKEKGRTVNGGWYHGSPLGAISPMTASNGVKQFRVTC